MVGPSSIATDSKSTEAKRWGVGAKAVVGKRQVRHEAYGRRVNNIRMRSCGCYPIRIAELRWQHGNGRLTCRDGWADREAGIIMRLCVTVFRDISGLQAYCVIAARQLIAAVWCTGPTRRSRPRQAGWLGVFVRLKKYIMDEALELQMTTRNQ